MKTWNCVLIGTVFAAVIFAGEGPGRAIAGMNNQKPGPSLITSPWRQLTTDFRGSRLIFSSPLTLRGESYHDFSKIYEINRAGQLRTLASVAPEPAMDAVLRPVDHSTNEPILDRPDVSSDGTVEAYTRYGWCVGNACDDRAEIAVVAGAELGSGRVRLSANGEWALRWEPLLLQYPNGRNRYALKNRKSGQEQAGEIFGQAATAGAGRRVVADDGTFAHVLASGNPYWLEVLTPGREARRIAVSEWLEEITIDTAARYVVGRTLSAPARLVLVDLGSGEEIPAISAEEGAMRPALSDDGGTLLFLSAANWGGAAEAPGVQVWSLDLTSGALTQWTQEAGGVVEATISGDGQVVWAVSGRGRLVRVERGGAVEEMLAPAPWWSVPREGYPTWGDFAPRVAAAGGRLTLGGVGLWQPKMAAGGVDLVTVNSSGAEATFALPQTTPLGLTTALLSGAGSPFEPQQLGLEVRRVAPQFLTVAVAPYQAAEGAVHADGSPVTEASPARRGELIVLRATGLGPVDEKGQTVQEYTVGLIGYEAVGGQYPEYAAANVTVMAASGPAGLYFVQFRVPAELPGGWTEVELRLKGETSVAAKAAVPVER